LRAATRDGCGPGRHNRPMRILALSVTLLAIACTPGIEPGTTDLPALASPAPGGAEGPRLSSAADGTVILSWMETGDTGSTLWYSRLGAGGWQPRQAVATGKRMFVNWADMPSVVPLSGRHWAAHWLEKAGDETYAYHVAVVQSFDGGDTWSEPVTPHTDGTPTEHGFVSLFAHDGAAAAIWLDGRNTGIAHDDDPAHTGMTLRGATIAADNTLRDEQLIDPLVCDCCQTDVAIAATGPVGVYRDRSPAEIRDVHVVSNVDNRWQQGTPLHRDGWEIAGCPVNGPAIAAAGPAVVAAWFTAAAEQPAVHVRFSADSAASFDAPIEIATAGALGHVDTVLLGDGSAVVSWLQSEGGGLAGLFVRRVRADGRLSAARQIAAGAPARSVPQMALAADALVLVWTETAQDGKGIRSARVDPASLTFD